MLSTLRMMFRETYLEKKIWIGKHFSQQWKILQFEFNNSKQNNQAVQAGFEMWTVLMLEAYYFFDVLLLNILKTKKLIMTVFQCKEITCIYNIVFIRTNRSVFICLSIFSAVLMIYKETKLLSYCVLDYL